MNNRMTLLIRITAPIFAVLFSITSYAQQSDSTDFAKGKWSEAAVANGMVLKQCDFSDSSLFNSNQYISVLEVDGMRFDIISAAKNTLEKTSKMAEKTNAEAAVNGSFFNMEPPYNSVNYLRVDGNVVDNNYCDVEVKQGSGRSFRQNGAIATWQGNMYILKADDLTEWEKYIQAEDVLTTGPVLIINSEDEQMVNTSFNTNRHPRTALGKQSDGTIVLVVVDGRNERAAGVSMTELQEIMRWLGCIEAINLDGGGSSTMVVNKKVVNHPSDNELFDPEGERVVQNAIVISK